MALKLTKTMKHVGIGAIFVAVVVLLVVIAWNLSAWMNRDSTVRESRSMREEVVPIAKLATYEYNFTQIIAYSSSNNFELLNIDIPFTDNHYLATIDGVATIYVDADRMAVEQTEDEKGEIESVSIRLPHSEIQKPIALDHGSLREYDNRDGLFNPITTDDYNGLLQLTEEEQAAKLQESGLLEKSDERVQELITAQITALCGDDVIIEFSWLEE